MTTKYQLEDFFIFLKNTNIEQLSNLLIIIKQLIDIGAEDQILAVIDSWYKNNDHLFDLNDFYQIYSLNPKNKGSIYIKQIIEYLLENETKQNDHLFTMYDVIARKNFTTSSRVARNINCAIYSSWDNMDSDIKNKVFSNINKRPGVKEYIKCITYYYCNNINCCEDMNKNKVLVKTK